MNEAIGKDVTKQFWKKAEAHRGGKGLEEGPCLAVVAKHLRSLEAAGKHSEYTTLLLTLVGGTWPRKRSADAGYKVSPLCPRCGAEEEN